MDSIDRKNKQEFLKKEILDKGYDREQFAEFMLNERDDGLNVDVWEFRELIMSVEDFTSTHKPIVNTNTEVINDEEANNSSEQINNYEDNYNNSNEYADNKDDPYFHEDEDDYSPDKNYSEPAEYSESLDNQESTPDQTPVSYSQPNEYEEPEMQSRESEYDVYARQSKEMMEMRQQQEEVREQIRQKERDEERKSLKDQKKVEREERRKTKAGKRAAKEAKVNETKSAIEAQLEEALKNENMAKTFSEMTPKNILDFKNRKDKLPGVQVPKTKLNGQEKIKVLVQEPEIVDEGFFLGKHLTFTIQTSPLGWKVKRRDKDFNVLRDYLVKAYPHILVPMCPEHHSTKSIDKNFLRKREHLLNKFMNKCMLQEELKGCPILVDFLNFEDCKQFSKFLKSALDEAPKLKFVSQFPSLSGSHKINVNKKAEVFCNQMEKYFSSHEVLFKKLHYLGKKLSSDLMEVSKTLCAISLCSKHISVLYEMGNSKEMAQTYNEMNDHFKKWGKETHDSAKITLKFMPQYFNYSSMENQSYKDLFSTRMKLLEAYVNKSNDLLAKKEKLFKTGRPEKWELSQESLEKVENLVKNKEEAFEAMLPQATKEVKEYEDSYMYLTSQCYKEIKKINREDVDELKDHLQEYAARIIEVIDESKLTWTQFETSLQEKTPGSKEI